MKVNATRKHSFSFKINHILNIPEEVDVDYYPEFEEIILEDNEKIQLIQEKTFIAVNQKEIKCKEYSLLEFCDFSNEAEPFKDYTGYYTKLFIYEYEYFNKKSCIISKKSLDELKLSIISAFAIMEEGML